MDTSHALASRIINPKYVHQLSYISPQPFFEAKTSTFVT